MTGPHATKQAGTTTEWAQWDQRALQHDRSVCSTCRKPFPDPQESLLAPVEEGARVREAAGLVCSAAEFSLIYLDIFLDIPRDGSLTNASTPRVKRF